MRRIFILSIFMAVVMLSIAPTQPAAAQDTDDQSKKSDESAASEDEAENPKVKDVQEDKPKINNLPQNFKGLSGLIFTTSTKVLAPGTVEIGPAVLQRQSYKPSFTQTVWAFNAGVGIPGNLEFGLHVPYVESNLHIKEYTNIFGSTVRQFSHQNHNGMGSVEGLMKWAINQQSLFLPAFAVGLGAILPSSDYKYFVSSVKTFGFKPMLAMSVEINDLFFTDYAFAVLADGAVVFNDLGDEDEEKHGEVHFGMVFPIAPRNYGTLIVEYEGMLMKGTTNEENTNSVLGGLRFTTQHINVTGGYQYAFMAVKDLEDQARIVANISYKFGPPYPLFP